MKTFVYVGTSLDGFIARENGDFDWLADFADDEAIRAYNEFTEKIDAIVIGRGTFEKILTFPSFPYQKRVFVLSRTLKKVPENLMDKVTILASEPKDLLSHLSGKGFSSIYIDGGKVIREFLKADVIDELTIAKVPVILGRGIALFGSLDCELQFSHLRTITQSNGLVRSYYQRIRN